MIEKLTGVLREQRWPRMLAAVVLVLAAVAYVNSALHSRAQSAENVSVQLGELDSLLREEAVLLWKTLADRNAPAKVARAVGALRSREDVILDSLGGKMPAPELADLRRQVAAYHPVLDEELQLLGVGKTDEARRIEKSQTEPQFQRLSKTVAIANHNFQQSAQNARTIANTVLFGAMFVAAWAIGWLLYRFERAHRAASHTSRELLAQQQAALDHAAEAEALVRHQALHDHLTGLPNRALFAEHLAASTGDLTTLLIDLDGFKQVNDTLGHGAGDTLLIQVAERLHESVRGTDLAARLGGDEFAVILNGTDKEAAVRTAQRILERLSQSYDLGGRTARISASIGIAIGRRNCSIDQLLADADAAMYHSKRTGKASYTVHRPTLT